METPSPIRPIRRSKGRLAKLVRGAIGILVAVLVLGLLASVFPMMSTASFYNYRLEDVDQDGLKNAMDPDVDNDGLDNIDDNDSDGDYVPNYQDIVQNALELDGRRYDFLRGHLWNYGGRIGLMVDIDVVNIAYEKAGIYLDRLMAEDYAKNPDTYDIMNDNTPKNPFFRRRVRNLFIFLENTNRLARAHRLPAPGDLIFYSHPEAKRRPAHVVLVTRVTNDDRVFVMQGSMKHGLKEVLESDVRERGFEPMHYGELLGY